MSIKKLIPLLIILFWAAMTFLLIYRHAPLSEFGVEAQLVLPESKEKWMGIYLKGQKIGYASSKFYSEIDGYTVHEEIKMNLVVLGTLQDIHTTTRVSLSPELKLRSFRFLMNAAQDINVEGKVQGKVLIIDIMTAGGKSRQEIQLDEVPYMNAALIPYLLKKGFKKGMRMKLPVFDPVTLSIQNLLIEVGGKEKIILRNKEVEAFKIKGDLNGLKLLMWIDEQGNELKEESPAGFTLITEPRVEAVRLPHSASDISDIITQTSIPFNLELPPDISYLKLRLKGIDFEGFELNGGGQTFEQGILEIVKQDINLSQYTSLPIPDKEQFLKETPFIQLKDYRIAGLAREIIGEEENPLAVGRLLWAWVFENIEKTPSITVPSALDVLKARRGDCNEHTTLYTALARSAGLPTRMSAGLVYKERHFYYHAWPEIFVGEWIAIDPTLGQFPADATHIRLISGDLDKQLILLKAINSIELEGIEYRR